MSSDNNLTNKHKSEPLNGHIGSGLPSLLHPTSVRHLVREWLKEDTPSFDYGGFVVGEKEETAVLLMKSPGVIAGLPFVEAIFDELDCHVRWFVTEGCYIEPDTGRVVAQISGKVRRLLLGERIALNCLCRASGIASISRRLQKLARGVGWMGEVAGTRKTTPGFRLVEKYALLVGGISTHRYDLSSMVMLKDNHIWTAGSISQAVKDARMTCGFSSKIEVECRSHGEAQEAADAGAEVIMLDNFDPKAAAVTAGQLKGEFPSVIIEVSGGIRESTLTQFCVKNIDVISLSCLTQGYEVVDFSMKIEKQHKDPRNLTVKL